ncbi:MAG: hypothetical protein SOY02_00830 [Candidatus Onthovivens sp.]|nr:hypothetical protein [Candidatus Onthovivens sp.]
MFKTTKSIELLIDFAIKPGDYFGLEINLNKLHIFDPITEERIEI